MKKWIFILLMASGCGAVKPYYNSEGSLETKLPDNPLHTVYLIGDAGDLHADDPLIPEIRPHLLSEDEGKSTLIFLGDNIYHHGLPDLDHPERAEKEQIIINQMNLVKDFNGNVFFIPGNHDWSDAGEEGRAAVSRQEIFVENYLNRGNVFLPDNACPGPVSVPLNDDLLLVLIDSQWWLHKHDKPSGEDCESSDQQSFVNRLSELIGANPDRNVLLVGHHPVLDNGEHGGRFGLKDHIFPLTNVRNYLYLPLPVIGSIYPISRSAGVSRQDIPNNFFKTYAAVIDSVFTLHDRLLYASGHDHNLQYIEKDGVRQIISGSGSKVNYASKGRGASFVYQQRGYARIYYYPDREVWLEFTAISGDYPEGLTVYRNRLF